MSKTPALGKGLKVMCLEGEAYMHAHAYVCIHMAENIGGPNMASLPPKGMINIGFKYFKFGGMEVHLKHHNKI